MGEVSGVGVWGRYLVWGRRYGVRGGRYGVWDVEDMSSIR